MSLFKTDIQKTTERIEKAIEKRVSKEIEEKHWVTHYGANDIHPKHLVYWICVQTDALKDRLDRDAALNKELRELLSEFNYPISGRNEVYIGFESQETVDRESSGNWWHHWK